MQSNTKSVFRTQCSWRACLGRWHLSRDHRVELEMTPQSIPGRCLRWTEWEGRAAAWWALRLCSGRVIKSHTQGRVDKEQTKHA